MARSCGRSGNSISSISQPTASEHLCILAGAGLIRGTRIKQWTFYKRAEKRITKVKQAFGKAW